MKKNQEEYANIDILYVSSFWVVWRHVLLVVSLATNVLALATPPTAIKQVLNKTDKTYIETNVS